MSSPAALLVRRNISRARRLARFLSTADPIFRVAATPSRIVSVTQDGATTLAEHGARVLGARADGGQIGPQCYDVTPAPGRGNSLARAVESL